MICFVGCPKKPTDEGRVPFGLDKASKTRPAVKASKKNDAAVKKDAAKSAGRRDAGADASADAKIDAAAPLSEEALFAQRLVASLRAKKLDAEIPTVQLSDAKPLGKLPLEGRMPAIALSRLSAAEVDKRIVVHGPWNEFPPLQQSPGPAVGALPRLGDLLAAFLLFFDALPGFLECALAHGGKELGVVDAGIGDKEAVGGQELAEDIAILPQDVLDEQVGVADEIADLTVPSSLVLEDGAGAMVAEELLEES